MNHAEFYMTLDRLFESRDRDRVKSFLDGQIEGIEAGETEADRELAAAVYNEAASFYRGRGNWDACLPLYEKLLRTLEEMGLSESEPYAIAKMNRATAYRFMGELEKAEADFTAAESLLISAGSGNTYALAGLYNNHAAVAAELNQPEKAIAMFKAALAALGENSGAQEERAVTLSGIALMYIRMGDLARASEYADNAVSEIGDASEHSHGGAVLSAKAHCCYLQGDRKKAAELFLKSAEITKSFFGENHEYQSCMENYRKALEKDE